MDRRLLRRRRLHICFTTILWVNGNIWSILSKRKITSIKRSLYGSSFSYVMLFQSVVNSFRYKDTSQNKNYSSLKISSCFFSCLFIISTQSLPCFRQGCSIQNTACITFQQYYCITPFANFVVAILKSSWGLLHYRFAL